MSKFSTLAAVASLAGNFHEQEAVDGDRIAEGIRFGNPGTVDLSRVVG